jgi:hypothetical protein
MNMAKIITEASLLAALNERDLFNNPDLMEIAAREIDCRSGCEFRHAEPDTNVAHCSAWEKGSYCSNDVAETLRALEALARRDGE